METEADRRLRRIMLTVLLTIIALPVIAFAVLCLWISATQGAPPAMFAGLPPDFRDERPWTARMAQTFPAGTPEAVLVQRLRGEGFTVDTTTRSGTYTWGNGVPCNHTVQIGWSAGAGRVTASRARYMNACW